MRCRTAQREGPKPRNPTAGSGVPLSPAICCATGIATGRAAAVGRAGALAGGFAGVAAASLPAFGGPPWALPRAVCDDPAERGRESAPRRDSSRNVMSLRPRSTERSSGVIPRTLCPPRSAPRSIASRAEAMSPRLMASNNASVGSAICPAADGATRSARGAAPGNAGGSAGPFFGSGGGPPIFGGPDPRVDGLEAFGMVCPANCAAAGCTPIPSPTAAARITNWRTGDGANLIRES